MTIHRRILTLLLLAVTATAVLAWGIGHRLYASALQQRLEEQLSRAAAVIAEGGFAYSPGVLSQVARLLQAELLVLEPDRRVMVSTFPPESEVEGLVREQQEPLSIPQAGQSVAEVKARDGTPYLAIYQGLTRQRDQGYAALVLVADLSDLREASRKAALWLALAATLGSLVLAWLVRRIARTITSPVAALAAMASEIAGGKRDVRAQLGRHDEIGELARALNTMAVRLTAYEGELAERSRQAARGEMAARVAHEIRNPLTAIRMQIELLLEQVNTPATSEVLRRLLEETERLNLIVSATLEQGRQGEVRIEPWSLQPLIKELVALLRPQLEHRHVAVEILAPGPQPAGVALLDRQKTRQVLLNLLLNASDAMGEGGRVRIGIAASEPDKRWVVLLEDDGPGIPEVLRPTLFAGADSLKPHGTGIGLGLCRDLMHQQGGEIALVEGSLGGAAFRLSFPMQGQA